MENAIFLNALGSFISTFASQFPGLVSTSGIFLGAMCQILSFRFAPASFISAMNTFVILWTLVLNHGKNTITHYQQALIIGIGLLLVVIGERDMGVVHVSIESEPIDFLFIGSVFGVFSLLLWNDDFMSMPSIMGGFTNTLVKMVMQFDGYLWLYVFFCVFFAIMQLVGLVWLLKKWGPERVNARYVGGLMVTCVGLERCVFVVDKSPYGEFYIGVCFIVFGCVYF